MRTALLLLLVAAAASAAAWGRWHSLLGAYPFLPPSVPGPTPAERAGGRRTGAALERPLPAGARLGPTLGVSLERFSAWGILISIDWGSLEEANFAWASSVAPEDVAGKTAGQALARLLELASKGAARRRDDLDFAADGDEVLISTRRELDPETATRVYDVRDVLRDPWEAWFGASPEPPAARQKRVARLTAKVRAAAPGSWRDDGGSVGSVQELAGQLVVTQTPRNQRLVQYVLARERWHGRWLQFGLRAAPLVGGCVSAAWLILLAAGWRGRRERRRLAAARCVKCGYDLRATPQCCPECGTAVPGASGGLRQPAGA